MVFNKNHDTGAVFFLYYNVQSMNKISVIMVKNIQNYTKPAKFVIILQ